MAIQKIKEGNSFNSYTQIFQIDSTNDLATLEADYNPHFGDKAELPNGTIYVRHSDGYSGDLWEIAQGSGGGVEVEAFSVTQNDTYTAPEGKAYSPVTVNVPNSYAAGDEGKVVSGGALVSQSSDTVIENGTVDTTLINSLTVNVSGSGGGADGDIIDRTISGTYTNSAVTSVGNCAFYSCKSLTTASFPSVTTIGSSAFYYCINLTTISFPKATSIGDLAFYNCYSLTTASFPLVTTIGNGAFYSCYNLTTANFPSATTIRTSAFSLCNRLTTISFPLVTIIGGSAFYYCNSLTTASFPSATTISAYAFCACHSLTTISFPLVTTIGSGAFNGCKNLTTASFPLVTTIGSSAFSSCYNLTSLYLSGTSVVTLGGSAVFTYTPIGGYSESAGQYGSVYVPSSLYSSYLTATYWSLISSRIVGY